MSRGCIRLSPLHVDRMRDNMSDRNLVPILRSMLTGGPIMGTFKLTTVVGLYVLIIPLFSHTYGLRINH
jgi:hypothetical protein